MAAAVVERERVVSVPGTSVAVVFEQWYSRYRRRVVLRFVSWGVDWAAAEDLADEVFTRLWEDAAGGRLELGQIEAPWGFLRKQAGWAMGRYVRARRAVFSLEDSPVPLDRNGALADTAPGPDTLAALRLDLKRGLAQLPAELRQVVVLRYLQDLSPVQVAARTGLAEGTVAERLRKALGVLRQTEGLPRYGRAQIQRARARETRAAIEAYRASVAAGAPLSMTALGAKFGHSDAWAAQHLREAGLYWPCPHPGTEAAARATLRGLLAAGTWAPGEQLPTIRQLGERLGVGASGANRVLAALAGEGLIERRFTRGGTRATYHALGPGAPLRPIPAELDTTGDSVRARVTAQITAAVVDGTYPPGALLPTGTQLAREHGVTCAYMTGVILAHLVHQGVLVRTGQRYTAAGAAPQTTTARARVADALREQIEAGLYPPGAPLPTPGQLAKLHAVSRDTARHALAALARAQLAEQHPDGRYRTPTLATVLPLRPALATNTYLTTGRTPTGTGTFPTARLEAAA
jgi:RNA polymerase sigma-70 factor (ECF subfamily)